MRWHVYLYASVSLHADQVVTAQTLSMSSQCDTWWGRGHFEFDFPFSQGLCLNEVMAFAQLFPNVSRLSIWTFRMRLKGGLLAITLFYLSVCSSGAYVVMLLHPNVGFLVKRGISKPSSALPAPRMRSRIQVPWMVTSMCGKGST